MQELVARNKANRKKLRKEYMKTIKEYWQIDKDIAVFRDCKTVLTSSEQETYHSLPTKKKELRLKFKKLFKEMNYPEGSYSYWQLKKMQELKTSEVVMEILLTLTLIVIVSAAAYATVYFYLLLLK